MDRKAMLALFSSRFPRMAAGEPLLPRADARRPLEVYQAAQVIRRRIHAALAASRRA